MKIFAIIIAITLLFGCLGSESAPEKPVEKNNETIQPTEIEVVVQNQQNQTVQVEQPDQEPEEEPSLEVDYSYEPELQTGIYFIYVGDEMLHGDSILIKKGDLDILVDAGSEQKADIVLDFLKTKKVDDIEVLIATNADERHYGGIELIADNYKIEELWWNGDELSNRDYANTVRNVDTKKTISVGEGYTRELNGIEFEILNPPSERFEEVNNDAIVSRITDRNFSMLLTSGIQTGAQGRLLNKWPEKINTQIMQAPYYGVGSGTSAISIFLITAEPQTMIISGSSDESAANGGSREPFKRLMKQYGIEWYENYANGTLRIVTNGNEYDVSAS